MLFTGKNRRGFKKQKMRKEQTTCKNVTQREREILGKNVKIKIKMLKIQDKI